MSQPQWKEARRFEDLRYEKWQGIAKVTINRPEVRNAFRPQTLFELSAAFEDAREDPDVGVVILTGQGNDAFCSGGDQRIRGDQGYVGKDGVPRLNVLDLQKQIRSLPKPVVAMRSEEHTSELQSQSNLVCRLLLEKKKNIYTAPCRRPQ